MIPIFPEFKKLEISDKSEVDAFVKNHPPYSDYNFISLWSWNTKEEVLISKLYDFIIIRFTDYVTGEPFFSFMGNGDTIKIINLLVDYSNKEDIKNELRLIPEASIVGLKEFLLEDISIIEDPDNHDYVLSINELAGLYGSALHKHRNLVHNFEREHPGAKLIELNINNSKICEDILDLFNKWVFDKKINNEESSHEQRALLRHLACARHYPGKLSIIGLYDEDNLIAFASFEIVHQQFAVSHFQKALKTYTGIYQFLMHMIAKSLQEKKVNFINIEQDLGLPGLRLSKKLWSPHHFLKKFIIKKGGKVSVGIVN